MFTSVIKSIEKRAILVESINDFVRDNNLDGIDIDYEELVGGGATVDNADTNMLLPFYRELREALPNSNTISIAVTGGYGWAAYHFRDIALDASKVLDFISVMSYDNTGTWGDSPLGDHSSVADGEGALNRYHIDFKVPKNKLVLGVPFYGRDFKEADKGFAEPITYKEILALNPMEEELTAGHFNRNKHNIFFNSRATISKKTKYVKDNGYKGVTVWELGQNTETSDDLSLLKGILEALKNSDTEE